MYFLWTHFGSRYMTFHHSDRIDLVKEHNWIQGRTSNSPGPTIAQVLDLEIDPGMANTSTVGGFMATPIAGGSSPEMQPLPHDLMIEINEHLQAGCLAMLGPSTHGFLGSMMSRRGFRKVLHRTMAAHFGLAGAGKSLRIFRSTS